VSAVPVSPAHVKRIEIATVDCVPVIRSGVRLVINSLNGAVLLAPERGLVLNETAAAVVGAIDGRRSVGEIVGLLRERYESRGPIPVTDVLALVDDLIAMSLARLHRVDST
jgi:pyrroloquinoline quinone biosynthesis protein D